MKTASLDPRVNRLQVPEYESDPAAKQALDQFPTFEVFEQIKEDKPYQHVGIVHAPNADMAFLFGKEQYTRRGNTCTGMFVICTQSVWVSAYTDGTTNVLDSLVLANQNNTQSTVFEVFYLKKRGKQHLHIGSVKADTYSQAAAEAARLYPESVCFNVWVVRRDNIVFSQPEDRDIWDTLSEKKYREAIAYRALERINEFKARQVSNVINK